MTQASHFGIRIIYTGGTISKTYDEAEETLRNRRPIIETIVAHLRLPEIAVSFEQLLSKDSRDLTDGDREMILEAVRKASESNDAVIILHGTDTLQVTGEMLHRELPNLRIPVILTGAMRPYEFRDSDAFQNVTEAMMATRLVAPGVYVAMHSKVLRFPGVVKDFETRTFRRVGALA